jgi:hypothetical protein
MFNNVTTIITKEYILSKVSQEQIFLKYLGFEPTDRGQFVNPLRTTDSNPGCSFYIDARGYWKFHDVAAKYNWDCFNVVEYNYNLGFKEALIRIAIDFGIIEGNQSTLYISSKQKVKRKAAQLRIKRRSWTKKDYAFWRDYHISPERLEFFSVSPVQQSWIAREDNILVPSYFYKESDPCYAYHFGGYEYKLYFPLRTIGKFLHANSTIIQGYSQLPQTGDNLLYTKSFKDVMCIDNFSQEFDLYSVAPMSETVVVNKDVFTDLYNRFDNQGTLFDFDRAGIRLMQRYKEAYKLQPYMFGMEFRSRLFGKEPIKDFADHLKIKGVDETKRLIERFISKKEYDGRNIF